MDILIVFHQKTGLNNCQLDLVIEFIRTNLSFIPQSFSKMTKILITNSRVKFNKSLVAVVTI